MNIPRTATPYLRSLILERQPGDNVIFVSGARQTGKTTLVRQALEGAGESIEINLETDRVLSSKIDRCAAFSDFEKILALECGLNTTRRQTIFIDEAQESERLGDFVREMKETWRNTAAVLSGSSMTRLFRPEQRIPVGRYTTLLVYPFTFVEFLRARGKAALEELQSAFPGRREISPVLHAEFLNELDLYLSVGGLPQVVVDYCRGRDCARTRMAVLLSQQDDFVRKAPLHRPALFMETMQGVANYLGYPSKYTHISDKYAEAKEAVELMCRWNLLHEVETKGLSATTRFLPKRYIYDIGVAQSVRNMPFPPLSLAATRNPGLRTQIGGLLENLVLLNLLPGQMHCFAVSAWKKNAQQPVEVDFVWRTPRDLVPIECKAGAKNTPRSFSAVRRFMAESGAKTGFVISAAPYLERREPGLRLINLPAYLCTPQAISALTQPL